MSTDPALPQREPAGPIGDALRTLSRFVTAVELNPLVAVYGFDRAGLLQFWNRACAELYGVEPALALGRPLQAVLGEHGQSGEMGQAVAAIWDGVQDGYTRDWRRPRPDGQEMWVCSAMFPVPRGGPAELIFCIDIDITARKREQDALAQAGANFIDLFALSADAIVLLRDEQIIDANPAAVSLFGHAGKQDLIGKALTELAPRQQLAVAEGQAAPIMDDGRQGDGNQRFEALYQTRTGALFWAEVLMTVIHFNAESLCYAVIRDISLRKSSERALQVAAQVFEHCRDAIVVTDAEHRVVATNQAYTALTGFGADEVVGKPLRDYTLDTRAPAVFREVWEHVDDYDHWQGEVWDLRKNGERYPAWCAVTAIRTGEGRAGNYMLILSDITDRKRDEEATRHLAEHDFLTDLPNRVLLLDRLNQAMAAARRRHAQLALLFLDLDRFKLINDTLGHHVGDLVLKEVAQRLLKCVRSADTVSRQGGDEFVIILAEIGGVEQAAHVAESVLQAIAQVRSVDGLAVALSTSIGICIFPDDGEDIDTLLQHADLAMYHAKEGGRGNFQFFSAAMNAQTALRTRLEHDLRHALTQREFVLAFQPEVDIVSGATIGVEALLRWRHPELGWLMPEQFIAAAEHSGMMPAIGNWVLGAACAQAQAWRDQGYPVVVAVNLSLAQFLQADLLASVDAALAESGLAPAFLELELTERMLIAGTPEMLAVLGTLHERGVHLTVDDFGRGQASLSTLNRVPLDKLKIDQSYVEAIGERPGEAAIVPAIIAMAKSLKLKVVAEGVETAEQLRFLQQHGCDEYQGNYAGAPAQGPELPKRLH